MQLHSLVHYLSNYTNFSFFSSLKTMRFFLDIGVSEEQFKESWTRPGAAGMGEGTSLVVAKSRM